MKYKITEVKIREIVNRIVENVKPEKVILFGSYARGDFNENSDIDICVIVDAKSENKDTSIKIRRLFRGVLIPMDIIVYSNKDIEEWKDVKMAFPTMITRNGKVLYEKN